MSGSEVAGARLWPAGWLEEGMTRGATGTLTGWLRASKLHAPTQRFCKALLRSKLGN